MNVVLYVPSCARYVKCQCINFFLLSSSSQVMIVTESSVSYYGWVMVNAVLFQCFVPAPVLPKSELKRNGNP